MSETIYAKINKVMEEIITVPKNGVNTHFNYKYVKEEDLLDMIRPLLIKHGLAYLPPSVIDQVRNGEFTKVNMKFTIADVETGQVLESCFWGEGQDKNDKGLYKAYTGATKYFLMKTFLIPTNDDAEQDGRQPRGNQPKGNQPPRNGQQPQGGQRPQGGQQPPRNGQQPQGGQRPQGGQQPPRNGQQPQGGQRPQGGQPPRSGQQPQGGQPRQGGQRPAPDIFTGKIKLTADADTGSERTPQGDMARVRIYGITMDNRPVLVEGWGSEMLPLMSDLVAGQTIMVQGAKTKLNAQNILRVSLNVTNFSVSSAA